MFFFYTLQVFFFKNLYIYCLISFTSMVVYSITSVRWNYTSSTPAQQVALCFSFFLRPCLASAGKHTSGEVPLYYQTQDAVRQTVDRYRTNRTAVVEGHPASAPPV